MSLELLTLSGSPFGWKVQLSLEHKGLDHTVRYLSVDAGELATPAHRALNPHGKVPVLLDDGFALYESDAIVDYLDTAYATRGPALWPAEPRARALAHRVVAEASAYLYPPLRQMVFGFLRPGASLSAADQRAASSAIAAQIAIFEPLIERGFVAAATPSAADFALYPMVALIKRVARKAPHSGAEALLRPAIAAWAKRIEGLPSFTRTMPPHWRES